MSAIRSRLSVVICFLLALGVMSSCATQALYAQRHGTPGSSHTTYLWRGTQTIEIHDGQCYLDYKGRKYRAEGLHDALGTFDRIVFWIDGSAPYPNCYQIEQGEAYLSSGHIVPTDECFTDAQVVSAQGVVATTRQEYGKPMPMSMVVALTPFVVAADIALISVEVAGGVVINPETYSGVRQP